MAYLSRDDARSLAERTLGFIRAEQARVTINSGDTGNTRFAANQITTSGDVTDTTVTVTTAYGRRVASSTTNRLDDDAIRAAVQTSERLAPLSPEDPEYLGELRPMRVPERDAVVASTADLTPEARARAAAAVTSAATARSLVSTGYIEHRTGSSAVMTTRGQFAYQASSNANFSTTVRTPDGTGSGWAGTGLFDWNELDAAALGARAIDKAERSREPRDVEPGRWVTILEPTAVANMVGLMMGSLGARAADEGRSYFSRPGGGNRIGERFLDERVTLWSDPLDARLFSAPFNGQGLPNRREAWVENGVLRTLAYDRFWAERQNREPTGFVSGYYMEGGNATLDDMIRSTERGLLVTRFWYIRGVDPRTILFTGLSRDGTFMIENGRVTYPVKNLRWNESPVFMLNNIEMMGRPVRVSPSESSEVSPAVVVPPLKVRDFTFTSVSDAV
ncbi:MAG: metallopeptidase TldD-related protein [Gemmatimonadota bacterium]